MATGQTHNTHHYPNESGFPKTPKVLQNTQAWLPALESPPLVRQHNYGQPRSKKHRLDLQDDMHGSAYTKRTSPSNREGLDPGGIIGAEGDRANTPGKPTQRRTRN